MDKWKHIRKSLWANTEPEVSLVGLTCPGNFDPNDDDIYFRANGINFHPEHIEQIVARAASVSTGVNVKDVNRLNRSLIKLGHHTPLEAIQFNFHVVGISKACGAQISRHRVGQGHVSSSRRYQEQGIQFVYPILDSTEDADDARKIYALTQDSYKDAYFTYTSLRKLGAKKGDARYVIPTASASERIWWVNARALRDFLQLRLHPTAESEIRRLAIMIHGIVSKITPTLFEDIDCD